MKLSLVLDSLISMQRNATGYFQSLKSDDLTFGSSESLKLFPKGGTGGGVSSNKVLS